MIFQFSAMWIKKHPFTRISFEYFRPPGINRSVILFWLKIKLQPITAWDNIYWVGGIALIRLWLRRSVQR